MKKLLLLSVFILFVVCIANGQTQQGKFLIGAGSNLSFQSTNEKHQYFQNNKNYIDEYDYNTFNFNINVGYFVINNLVIGLDPGISNSEYDNSTSKRFTVGPMGRYYFGITNIKPFIGTHLGWINQNDFNKDDNFTTNYHGSYIGINGGVAFLLTKNIALEAALDYTGSSEKRTNGEYDEYDFRKLTFEIGFALHF